MSNMHSPYLDLRWGDCMTVMREFPDGHFIVRINQETSQDTLF
jgi:hypothetical protein